MFCLNIGDQLIKDVYDAVRASPLWEKTALIITYDEHGGENIAMYSCV